MFTLVSLLVTAALVSLSGLQAYAAIIDRSKIDIDNNLEPNVVSSRKRNFVQPYIRIKGLPETINLISSEPVVLECEVYASPSPSVRWLKNGVLVDHFDEDSNEIPSEHPFSIAHMTAKIVETTPRNGDVFTCLASSGVEQLRLSTTFTVQEEPDLMRLDITPPMKPVITAAYNEIIQNTGPNMVLPCRAHSDTHAQVYWEDNEENLVYGNSRLRMLPSGDLLITNLRWDDMGVYTCTVKNVYGKDSVATFVYPARAG